MEQKPFYYWCGGALLILVVSLLIVYFIKKRKKDTFDKNKNTQINDKQKATNNINTGGWKCACEGSLFLPQSLQGSVAMFNMGVGGCYHKQT